MQAKRVAAWHQESWQRPAKCFGELAELPVLTFGPALAAFISGPNLVTDSERARLLAGEVLLE